MIIKEFEMGMVQIFAPTGDFHSGWAGKSSKFKFSAHDVIHIVLTCSLLAPPPKKQQQKTESTIHR